MFRFFFFKFEGKMFLDGCNNRFPDNIISAVAWPQTQTEPVSMFITDR